MAANLTCYRCLICGYIYDPERGDRAGGIPPGIPFEILPPLYRCPGCGAYATAGGRKPFVPWTPPARQGTGVRI
jgi:rubredoxin